MDATTLTHPASTGCGGSHPRLAELVVHLTGCDPGRAVAAVDRAAGSTDDRLDIVARAMVALRRIDLREPPTLPQP